MATAATTNIETAADTGLTLVPGDPVVVKNTIAHAVKEREI